MASVCAVNTPSTADNNLEKVTVIAAHADRSISNVAGTVSIIRVKTIEESVIQDLFRYEEGFSVSGGGHFGFCGFTIKGIGSARVLTQIDSALAPDELIFGLFLSFQNVFFDVDAVQAVEVIRAPASLVYGSETLGEVVCFLSKDPADYSRNSDYPVYAAVKGGPRVF